MTPADSLKPTQKDSATEKFSSRGLKTTAKGEKNSDPLAGLTELPRANFSSEDPFAIAQQISERAQNSSEVFYVKIGRVPLIVSAAITPETAVENFKKLKTQMSRAELGVIWTEAVARCEKLNKKINSLSGKKRTLLIEQLRQQNRGEKSFKGVEEYVMRPSIDSAMELAWELLGDNDAQKLDRLVEKIKSLLLEI